MENSSSNKEVKTEGDEENKPLVINKKLIKIFIYHLIIIYLII